MIAEQAEHDQAAADAAAADFEANEKKRPAPKPFTRSDDETPVEGVEEATSKCFRCGGVGGRLVVLGLLGDHGFFFIRINVPGAVHVQI